MVNFFETCMVQAYLMYNASYIVVVKIIKTDLYVVSTTSLMILFTSTCMPGMLYVRFHVTGHQNYDVIGLVILSFACSIAEKANSTRKWRTISPQGLGFKVSRVMSKIRTQYDPVRHVKTITVVLESARAVTLCSFENF